MTKEFKCQGSLSSEFLSCQKVEQSSQDFKITAPADAVEQALIPRHFQRSPPLHRLRP